MIHKESLQHWLSSATLSFLAVSRRPVRELPWLCNLLRNLPPSCHLRSLLIWYPLTIGNEAEMEKIVDAFCESPACKLDSLFLICQTLPLLNPQYASKLGRKCRSLFVTSSSRKEADYANSLLDFMSLQQTADCKLQELTVINPRLSESFFVDYMTGLKKLESCKQLKRLDMSNLPPLGPDGMSLLVASVASPTCSIHDLGINLSSTPHLNKTRFSILGQAFQCGSSLSKLKVLRFRGVDTDEAAACVVEILGCPESNCKVRFLQIEIHSLKEPFFKKLHQAAVVRPPRIECLRITLYYRMSDIERESELACLSDFLGQEHCSLLWLQCELNNKKSINESLEMKVANALEANFSLTSLHITTFTSPAARSRATAFLARNRLYNAMGLSKEDQMKPNMARLFLCGHGEAGKTTLRKALIKLNHNHPTSSPSTSPPVYHGCSFNMCFQPRKHTTQHVEQRTRGLEIHQLAFGPTQKLVMFDLGGQPDYHIFHHYFMTNTSHDLFIIVSKYNSSTEASQLASELEYWLRFIVSHQNSVHGPKPKVMLVVNFFHIAASLTEMHSIAVDHLTQHLRQKYAEQLNFGDPAGPHAFGIVALNASQARPILERLKMLLGDVLNHKPMIPKVCNDLLFHTLPLLAKQKKQYTCGFGWRLHDAREDRTTFNKVIVDYAEVKEHYVQQQDQVHQTEGEVLKLEKRIQAALTELHYLGEVVFFPPVVVPKEAETSEFSNAKAETAPTMPPDSSSVANSATSSPQRKGKSPIIVDPNWFCNKVIGDLLASKELSGKPEWKEINIKQFLIKSGCQVHFVDEVLRYMISLDLCYLFYDNASKSNAKFLFPAVASEKKLHWPPNFKSHRGDNNSMHFYGRRIRCKETERHLIPTGVFTRLQVKLQNFCGVGNYQAYKLGYHWASFVKNKVGVMVRFGRVSPTTNVRVAATKSVINVDDDQASIIEQSNTLPINMEEDDHPEWIDILVCYASSQDAATSAEDTIMQHIKKLIFDICQATSRGIPTVVLEESALRHEAREDVMPLTEIEACISENGLTGVVSWEDQETTSVVDLLLPEELQRHVMSHVQAIQEIQGEFLSSIPYKDGEGDLLSNEDNKEHGEGDQQLYQQLPGELKILYRLIYRDFERMGAKMDDVLDLVKEIKQDVHKVMRGLRQVELNIVAKCSTGLLEQLLIQGVLPAYAYLTNSDGKMQRLKNFLRGRKATVHFLCESGPHIVEGQTGREVVVEKGILMKWAPFLVPALMVLCCAARFAANVYLPGVADLLIFNPLLDCLKSIGITDEDLQSKIAPQALNALFDKLDVKLQELDDMKAPFININEGQRKEGIEALQKILGSIKDLDVEMDFGLCLVQVGRTRAQWLCKEHAGVNPKLKLHPSNPFRAK